MGFLPQVNATLISVTRGQLSEDYDRAEGTVPPVWQGQEDAYVQRKDRSTFNDREELIRALEVTMYLSEDFTLTLEPGDVLTYMAGNPDRSVTLAGRVQNVVDPAYMPQLSDYYKIALEEINVP